MKQIKPQIAKKLIALLVIVVAVLLFLLTRDYLSGIADGWSTVAASVNGEADSIVVPANGSLSERLGSTVFQWLPSIILVLITGVAWKRRRLGGWSLIGYAVVLAGVFWNHIGLLQNALVSISTVLVGTLFILHSKKYPKRRKRRT